MKKKQERKGIAKALKHTGLSLPIRFRLAKFHLNGRASGCTTLPDLLKHLNLNAINTLGPEATTIYADEKKGRLTIRSNSLYSEIQEGRRRLRG